MRIAYLTSRDMVPGAPGARQDLFELELQLAAILPACAARGLHLDLRTWEDPALIWAARTGVYEAVVLGTPWNYTDNAEEFYGVLELINGSCPVLNPPDVVRWNGHKSYLVDLEAEGVPVVPTVWVERVGPQSIAAARLRLGDGPLVAKPVVGACAVRQVRISPGAPLPPASACPPGHAMVQPFLPAIQDEGELSFLFFGGQFSHALQKRPQAGDYRVQSVYGGHERVHVPTPGELELARSVLSAVPTPDLARLLIARVDLVRDPRGQLRVMELELIEPYLYPEQGPDMGAVFADALAAALRQGPTDRQQPLG